MFLGHMALRLLIVGVVLQLATCRNPLILISCDGFRYDYLDWYPNETQFIRQLIPKGVHVKRMTTTFATKTFPSHWTIATGLYQESHGIVSNFMYDPVFNATFTRASREERWWNSSLPVWISARKQGLKSATYFWPGSEIEFQGMRQNFYYEYNGTISFAVRVKKVLEWIAQDGVDFATLYLNQPDTAGHNFGPMSKEVREALQLVDDTLALLFRGLKERNLQNTVNVIIVSDHGMADISSSKQIDLGNQLDPYAYKVVETGPLLGVFPKPGMKQGLLEFLKAEVKTRNLNMRVFAKEELPAHYHYSTHRRIPDVLALPDQHYVIKTKHSKPFKRGDHGFDNAYSDMKVPMFAVGPSFRQNVELEGGFRQVDIYGLVCHLLEIKPQPNNGSLQLLPVMLANSSSGIGGLFRRLAQFVTSALVSVMGKLSHD